MIFQGQEEGKAGKFQVLFSPLVGVPALSPHHCSIGIGHPQPILVIYQIPASAQCFPAEIEPLKEASQIK